LKSAADYLSSLDLKFLHNSQNHLAILRLIVYAQIWLNLQFWVAETCTLKMSNFHFRRDSAKFKPVTLCVSKAMSPPLTCSGAGGGLGAEGATLYFASLVAASRP